MNRLFIYNWYFNDYKIIEGRSGIDRNYRRCFRIIQPMENIKISLVISVNP